MRTSKAGTNFIKGFEQLKLVPYKCSGGWWTIGYGHAISKTEKPYWEVTEEMAEWFLEKDVAKSEGAVDRLIRVSLTQNQFDALVSFTFNLGGGALQRSTLRQKLNRGEYDEIPDEFMKWVRAGGFVLKGLVRRRTAEGRIFMTKETLNGVSA